MNETDNAADQLRKIIKVSTRIRQDQLRKLLKTDEDTFNERIIEWAEEFGFKIDGDYVAFGGGDMDAFIQSLDQQFAEWTGAETSKAGKVGHAEPTTVVPKPTAKPQPKPVAKPKPATSGKKDYHGTPLDASEHEFMMALVDQLGKSVPVLTTTPEFTSFGFIAQGGHVTQLGLYQQELASLPETLGSLSALQALSLHTNLFTFLPDNLWNLSSLAYLNLGHNQLNSLPETLGNLTALQLLDLDGNQITSLPESFGQLASLQNLDLSKNQLGWFKLPEALGNLKSLQRLWLNVNQLVSLPETLGQLTTLQNLYLQFNQLTSLPESFGQLSSLKELGLNNNEFKSLPETLLRLNALHTLSIDKRLAGDRVAKALKKRKVSVQAV